MLAIVTGASSGIGASLAQQLARRGATLVLIGRNQERLVQLCSALPNASFYRCDLSNPQDLSGLLSRYPHADILINCAGETIAAPYLQRTEESIHAELAASVLALARLCRQYGQGMAAHGGGRIVNIASVAALRPAPGMALYAATKAFMLHLSRSLAAELASQNVSVTCCLPGPTQSRFTARAALREHTHAMSADVVARQALAAMDAGAVEVIIGLRNKLQYALLRFLPYQLVARLARQRAAKRMVVS